MLQATTVNIQLIDTTDNFTSVYNKNLVTNRQGFLSLLILLSDQFLLLPERAH